MLSIADAILHSTDIIFRMNSLCSIAKKIVSLGTPMILCEYVCVCICNILAPVFNSEKFT